MILSTSGASERGLEALMFLLRALFCLNTNCLPGSTRLLSTYQPPNFVGLFHVNMQTASWCCIKSRDIAELTQTMLTLEAIMKNKHFENRRGSSLGDVYKHRGFNKITVIL